LFVIGKKYFLWSRAFRVGVVMGYQSIGCLNIILSGTIVLEKFNYTTSGKELLKLTY